MKGSKSNFLRRRLRLLVSDGKVTGLKAVRMELGEPDASGRRRPVPVVGSEYVVNADTIIPAIGQVIDPDLWDTAGSLGQTRKNTIECDKVTFATSIEGVFAGGDAVSGPATVVEAVAAGKEVAESIHRYINGMDLAEGRPVKYPENPEYPPIPEEIKTERRAINPEIEASQRKGFREVELALAEEEAQREANRCLNCGVCSECMECVKACPAQAIDHSMED